MLLQQARRRGCPQLLRQRLGWRGLAWRLACRRSRAAGEQRDQLVLNGALALGGGGQAGGLGRPLVSLCHLLALLRARRQAGLGPHLLRCCLRTRLQAALAARLALLLRALAPPPLSMPGQMLAAAAQAAIKVFQWVKLTALRQGWQVGAAAP